MCVPGQCIAWIDLPTDNIVTEVCLIKRRRRRRLCIMLQPLTYGTYTHVTSLLTASLSGRSVVRIFTIQIINPTQTPLNRFAVYILYSQLCNKCSGKSNTWNLGLSLSEATSVVDAINSCPPSVTLCIAAQRVALIIFF